jgi:hypothetical protein
MTAGTSIKETGEQDEQGRCESEIVLMTECKFGEQHDNSNSL